MLSSYIPLGSINTPEPTRVLSDVTLSLFAKPIDNRIETICQFDRPDLPFSFHLAPPLNP
jgi:hypothetical protein